jgi:hypothetical protein
MQNRSNRGSGKPVWVRVHYQPALMIGTRPKRIALGPAAHRTQQQAGHMTALDQFAAKIHLAKTEPSTHDPKRTLAPLSTERWTRRHRLLLTQVHKDRVSALQLLRSCFGLATEPIS